MERIGSITKGKTMKTLVLLFFITALGAIAQVPVTVTFNVPSNLYLKDVEQSRFLQRNTSALEGTVAGAITSSQTSITISGICPASNTAIYIDAEPMLVTAGSGTATCTVTRNSALSQAATTATAHSTGAVVYELKYASATAYFVQAGVAAFVVQCVTSLGNNSAVIGSDLTAVTTAQAAVNAALVGTAQ